MQIVGGRDCRQSERVRCHRPKPLTDNPRDCGAMRENNGEKKLPAGRALSPKSVNAVRQTEVAVGHATECTGWFRSATLPFVVVFLGSLKERQNVAYDNGPVEWLQRLQETKEIMITYAVACSSEQTSHGLPEVSDPALALVSISRR